jgi:hypothetical protein
MPQLSWWNMATTNVISPQAQKAAEVVEAAAAQGLVLANA